MVPGFRGRSVDTKRVMSLQLDRNNSVLVCVILWSCCRLNNVIMTIVRHMSFRMQLSPESHAGSGPLSEMGVELN